MTFTPEINEQITKAHRRAKLRRLHAEAQGEGNERKHEDRKKVAMFTCSQALYSLLEDEATEFFEDGRPNIEHTVRKILSLHFGISEEAADCEKFEKVINKNKEENAKKLLKGHLEKILDN